MAFVFKDGKRVAVLRPKNPQAAIAHALKAKRIQRWSNYPGETEFVGYMAASESGPTSIFTARKGKLGKVLNTEGEVIGNILPGDIFATPHDEEPVEEEATNGV